MYPYRADQRREPPGAILEEGMQTKFRDFEPAEKRDGDGDGGG